MKQALLSWEQPQLVLLGRGNPEERVLGGKCTLMDPPPDVPDARNFDNDEPVGS